MGTPKSPEKTSDVRTVSGQKPGYLSQLSREDWRFILMLIVLVAGLVTTFTTQGGDITALRQRLVRVESDLEQSEPVWLDIQTRLARIETALIYIQERLPERRESQ